MTLQAISIPQSPIDTNYIPKLFLGCKGCVLNLTGLRSCSKPQQGGGSPNAQPKKLDNSEYIRQEGMIKNHSSFSNPISLHKLDL